MKYDPDLTRILDDLANDYGIPKDGERLKRVQKALQDQTDYLSTGIKVGDRTMELVFKPNGITNLSDMQRFMNAVEEALPKGGAA